MTAVSIDRYLCSPLAVLALWQPHAILCVAPDPAHGGEPGKPHETRSWPARGPFPFCVAIHAAKKFDGAIKDSIATPAIREALLRCGFYPGDPRPFTTRRILPPNRMRALPLGAIVGLATVVYAERMATHVDPAHDDDRAFGLWSPERFAWRLADAVMLPMPIPHSGRQEALYSPDIELREEINRQLRAIEAAA